MTVLWHTDTVLAPLTTLRVGGPAAHYTVVSTIEDLHDAVKAAQTAAWPLFVLGGGSNILVADIGYAGAVLHMKLRGCTYTEEGDSVFLTAAAGEVFDDVVKESVERGYFGLENLSAIPGTVGATPIQNVGAYGVEVGDVITSVRVFNTQTKSEEVMTKEQCQFGYRHSLFKEVAGAHYIVTAVTFQLSKRVTPQLTYKDLALHFGSNTHPTVSAVREAVLSIRTTKFPNWQEIGTAGSFFKNPIITKEQAAALAERHLGIPLYEVDASHMKVPLGFVLDKICNLKGYHVGTVGLYEAQALVLVAEHGTTAAAISEFAAAIAAKVFAATGLTIEREVTQK